MNRLVLLVTDPSTTVAEFSGAFRLWGNGWTDGDSFALYSAGPGFLVYGEPFPRQPPGGPRPPAGEKFDDQVLLNGVHGMLAELEGGRRLMTLWLAGAPSAREDTISELESLGEVLDRETVARTVGDGGAASAPSTQGDDHGGQDGHEDDSWTTLGSWIAPGVNFEDFPESDEPEAELDPEPEHDDEREDGGDADRGEKDDSGVVALAVVAVLIAFVLVSLGILAGVGYGLWWGVGKAVSAVQGVLDDESTTVDAPASLSAPDDDAPPHAEDPARPGGELTEPVVGTGLQPWESVFALGVCSAGPDPAGGNRVVVVDCGDERAEFRTVAVFRSPTAADSCPANSSDELLVQGTLVCRIPVRD